MPQYHHCAAQQLETKPAWAGLGWAGGISPDNLSSEGWGAGPVSSVQSWVTQPGACHQCDQCDLPPVCRYTRLASGRYTPLIIVIMDLSAFYEDAVWIRFHN